VGGLAPADSGLSLVDTLADRAERQERRRHRQRTEFARVRRTPI
jgi:hypothetical protein